MTILTLMLRWLRRRVQLIRYYSAAQERTAWTRAMDIAIVTAFILAWPAAWLASAVVESSMPEGEVTADLHRRDGKLVAAVRDSDATMRIDSAGYEGTVTIEFWRMRRGWPFASAEVWLVPNVKLTRAGETKARQVQLARGTEEWLAIEHTLSETAPAPALESWRNAAPTHRTHALAFVTNALALWLVLMVSAWFAIGAAQFATTIARRLRWSIAFRRRRAGCCEECGYDLRGLEFSERCPECGALAE